MQILQKNINCDFSPIQFDLFMKYVKHMIDIKIMLILQRSIRRNRQYVCKSRTQNKCPVDKTHRNQCRACRLNKCIKAGMNRDGEQSIYHSIYTFTYLHQIFLTFVHLGNKVVLFDFFSYIKNILCITIWLTFLEVKIIIFSKVSTYPV